MPPQCYEPYMIHACVDVRHTRLRDTPHRSPRRPPSNATRSNDQRRGQDSKRIPRIQRIPRGINGPSSACGSNTRRTLNHPYTLPCRPVGRWAPRTMLPPGGLHSPERRQLLVHTTPFNINIIWHQRGVSLFPAELEAILSFHA